jgi:hypothetical protein
MANNHSSWLAQRIQQSDHVAHQMEEGILIDRARTLRLAVAAHIGSDSAISGLGKAGELMTPGVRRLRKAVTKEHGRSFSLFGYMNADPICMNCVTTNLLHLPRLLWTPFLSSFAR